MTIEEIAKQKELLGIQMGVPELEAIAGAIHPPVSLLVFGLGNDSIFWHTLNKGGTTVFIEDKKKWFDEITGKYPELKAYKVKYGTKRGEWRELIDHPEKLSLPLPSEITRTKWDVILVDGPAGHDDEAPGRMKSIYMASALLKRGGDVFVHDAQREVENAYCERYFGKGNLVNEISGFSTLHHYKP